MAFYNVMYLEGNSTCKCGYTVEASSESEAISKWRKIDAGKSGRFRVVDVYKIGTR